MEREYTINLVDDIELDNLHDYLNDIIKTAFLVEGMYVSDEFIDAIIFDDLATIDYKGTNGNTITVHEIALVNNVACAVELLFTLLKSETFALSFASVSGFASQIMRKEAIQGLHIPTVYATNLRGFGDTIQKNLIEIQNNYHPLNLEGTLDNENEIAGHLQTCSEIIKFLCSSKWFVSGNNILGYLMSIGYLYSKCGCIYLLDEDKEDMEGLKFSYENGVIFDEWLQSEN